MGWHHDQSYMTEPAIGSMLCAFQLPAWGGDLICQPGRCLRGLAGNYEVRLDGLRAVHSYEYFNGTWSVPTNEIGEPHPTGPATRGPYPSDYWPQGHLRGPGHGALIDGLPEDESRDLLDELFDWIVRPEFVTVINGSRVMLSVGQRVDHASAGCVRSRFTRLMKRTTIRPRPELAVPSDKPNPGGGTSACIFVLRPYLPCIRKEPGHGTVDSPCVGICQLDLTADLCIGCFRTRDEVAVWGAASDDVKRDILAKLENAVPPARKGSEDECRAG